MKKIFKQLGNSISSNIQNFNPCKTVADHLISKNHTHGHRIIVGLGVMVVGVIISKSGASGTAIVHIMTDGVGYAIHGMGAMPLLELIEKWRSNDNGQ
jgi:hypothetical protein